MNCCNCFHYNHNRIPDQPSPCRFRKNMCMDSKNCKHFCFLANTGDIFQTKCDCGNPMTTTLRTFGGYSTYCDKCKEKDRLKREDIAWRIYKECRYCDFFIRIPKQIEKRIKPQGICIIKGDEEEDDDPFHPYLSSSFSRKCECFSFNYDNFKTSLFEHKRWKNWNKWLEENLWKMATGKFSMSEYYDAVRTKYPHPETGEPMDVGDSNYWNE